MCHKIVWRMFSVYANKFIDDTKNVRIFLALLNWNNFELNVCTHTTKLNEKFNLKRKWIICDIDTTIKYVSFWKKSIKMKVSVNKLCGNGSGFSGFIHPIQLIFYVSFYISRFLSIRGFSYHDIFLHTKTKSGSWYRYLSSLFIVNSNTKNTKRRE